MKRVARRKVICVNQKSGFYLRPKSGLKLFSANEIRWRLEEVGLKNVTLAYVTHSVPQMFDLLGESNMEMFETVVGHIPFLRSIAGSIIAQGLVED